MGKNDNRLSVNLSDEADQFLLNWWSPLTDRTMSSLASSLIEQALTQAPVNDEIPEEVMGAYLDFIKAKAENQAQQFQEQIRTVKNDFPY